MLRIRLLGPPAIERDGAPAPPPRGRKAWALLAYLLLAERPPSRRHLAELLFGEADDPLGALRWTLAELRRALGTPGLFGGDPVATTLGAGVEVDLLALTGEPADPRSLLDLDGELLDGVGVAASPTFESWLVVERHRLAAAAEARLRQAALALLASGQAGAAVAYASRAVARNPLEEGNHELLVRSLAASGDRAAALRQVAVCQDVLRRELGIEASAALAEAAAAPAGSPRGSPATGVAAVTSQLDAGRAAIAAGAVEAGIDSLRRACADASARHDPALQGRALAALGGALVHAIRGRDEEGAIVLHEAVRLATEAGDRETAVTAYRELGYVDVQAGRRQTAESWLARAEATASSDVELAAVLGVRGMNASDMGDYPAAFRHLQGSVERARRAPTRGSRPGRCRSWPGPTCSATSAARPPPPWPTPSSWCARNAGWRSCPGRRRSRGSSTSAPAAWTPPPTSSSTPGRWPTTWTTPAGRAWPPAASACSAPPGATAPARPPGWPRPASAAPGPPTATSG